MFNASTATPVYSEDATFQPKILRDHTPATKETQTQPT